MGRERNRAAGNGERAKTYSRTGEVLVDGKPQVPFDFAQGGLARDKTALRNDQFFEIVAALLND